MNCKSSSLSEAIVSPERGGFDGSGHSVDTFKKPKLYLDVDGVLFMERRDRMTNEINLRPFVTNFLEWCHHNFDCSWITNWNYRARELSKMLYAIGPNSWPVCEIAIQSGAYETSNKTSFPKSFYINHQEFFIWIDGGATAIDIRRMETSKGYLVPCDSSSLWALDDVVSRTVKIVRNHLTDEQLEWIGFRNEYRIR